MRMARDPRVNKRAPPGQAGRRPPTHPASLAGTRVPRDPRVPRRRALDFLDGSIPRAASIPIALWVCAAMVAHLAGGGGAMKAAEIVHDRDELRAAVRFVRDGMHASDTTFELLTDDAVPAPQNVEPPKEDAPGEAKADDEKDPDAPKVDPTAKPTAPPKPKDKPEPPKKEEKKPEPPKPEPPKPPPPKPLAPLAAQPAAPPPPPPPPPEMDHRQAVQQHVKKDQPDNKSAQRISDDANTVENETMAKVRAQDQDAPKPSLGPSTGGPKDLVGNDKEEHSGSAENHKGDDQHAPGEANKAATDSQHEQPAPPVPPTPKAAPPPSIPGAQGRGGRGAAQPAAPPASPGGAGPASPEVVTNERGAGYSLDPANPGGDGKTKRPGKRRAPSPFESPVHVGALGLGGSGMPGGPQINLSMAGVVAAVGNEQLTKERAADGQARRAAHMGRWDKNKFSKWLPAIENYEPSVKLDNTTALNAARSPFATYLVAIHNRIHPIFAEEYLEFYNSRPKTDKVNDMTVVTHLEIVLDKNTGRIVRMGVTKPSGITEYDITALKAVDRAQPFGKAPDIIASPDGNVYLHWEFHRDPFDACTTRNARPFILKEAPKKPAAAVGPVKRPAAGAADDRSAPSGPLVPLREP
jgi:hypothetical protein